jgi:DNA-binding winged helix-turn-helix (wHTH) protein
MRVATVSATQQVLRFGVFGINLATEQLRKSEAVVKLPPQPFKLLVLLASRAGQVVTREEIKQEFWGKEIDIDFERRMNQCIQQIRTALGDDAAQPLYIETVHRRGYRFIALVTSKPVPASPSRIRESSSGVERNIAARVLARIEEIKAMTSADSPASTTTSVVDSAARLRSERQRRRWFIAAGLLLLALGGGGAFYWRPHKASALTEKDTIVLADFDNKTGDAVFDDALKQALAIQLEQSPFLNVLSRKVAGTLKLMKRSASERLTEEVTHEICLRTNGKAMLTGSISQLGSQYVIGLKTVDCNTGDVLAEAQEGATGKEGVLKALDAAAKDLRRKLGESLGSVQKYATPLNEVTTPSLEALKAYSLGSKVHNAVGRASHGGSGPRSDR